MNDLHKTCRTCGAAFIFTEKEQTILQKIAPVFNGVRYDIPAPETCGQCRMRHLMVYQNSVNLYKHTSAITGKELISNIRSDSGFSVVEWDIHSSDDFEGQVYGQDVALDRPFFEQYHELNKRVPRMNLSNMQPEDSPYVNSTGFQRNCYFVFSAGYNKDCYYSYHLWNSDKTMDCLTSDHLEKSYGCVECHNCFNTMYSLQSDRCNDSFMLYNCKNCDKCIGCYGLRNKEYHVYNKPVSKEEYEALAARIRGASYAEIQSMWTQFLASIKDFPRRYYTGDHNENVSGNYLNHCRDVLRCTTMDECDNCYDSMHMKQTKDAISIYHWGIDSELLYNCASVGFAVQQIAFCTSITTSCTNLYYCEYMDSCRDCFGCSGLDDKQYCIFNKQYSKEDYESLVPQIIEGMRDRGEWGEFFPINNSPFAYNESVADLYFPLSKEEIEGRGLRYSQPKDIDFTSFYPLSSDRIQDVDDSIINQVVRCETSGAPFRITGQEYAFYKLHGVPIPRRSFIQRLKERMKFITPFALWNRACDNCQTPLQTAYERERVYCEECYAQHIG